VHEGEAYSPDELSHLAYDPFPARLTVHLPGPPLEAPEGFTVTNGGRDLAAAGPSLWEALKSLEGRWLTPDPMLLYVERGGQAGGHPLDLDTFVAQPRHSEPPPTTKEVQLALEERLRPASLYRVTFAVQPDADLTREEVGGGRSGCRKQNRRWRVSHLGASTLNADWCICRLANHLDPLRSER